MCVDPSGLNSPVEMETDGPFIEDVQMLKNTVQARAIQVTQRTEQSFIIIIIIMIRVTCSDPERQRLLL